MTLYARSIISRSLRRSSGRVPSGLRARVAGRTGLACLVQSGTGPPAGPEGLTPKRNLREAMPHQGASGRSHAEAEFTWKPCPTTTCGEYHHGAHKLVKSVTIVPTNLWRVSPLCPQTCECHHCAIVCLPTRVFRGRKSLEFGTLRDPGGGGGGIAPGPDSASHFAACHLRRKWVLLAARWLHGRVAARELVAAWHQLAPRVRGRSSALAADGLKGANQMT